MPSTHSLRDASTTAQQRPHSLEKSVAGVQLPSGPGAEQELAPASGLELRSATLLAASVPDAVHAPSLPAPRHDNRDADSPQPVPALDPPASAPSPTATGPPVDPAPVPAPANGPLQIAPAVELAATATKPASAGAPHPGAESAGPDLPLAGHKLGESQSGMPELAASCARAPAARHGR